MPLEHAMNPPSGSGNVPWRLERLEEIERDKNEPTRELARKHETELHSELGVFDALESMNKRLGLINVAMWTLVVAVIGAAVVIALAVH